MVKSSNTDIESRQNGSILRYDMQRVAIHKGTMMQMKSFLTIGLVLIGSLISAQQSSFLVDKVVAKVGSEFILLSEVEDQYAYAIGQDPSLEESIKCEILDGLVSIMYYDR